MIAEIFLCWLNLSVQSFTFKTHNYISFGPVKLHDMRGDVERHSPWQNRLSRTVHSAPRHKINKFAIQLSIFGSSAAQHHPEMQISQPPQHLLAAAWLSGSCTPAQRS